MEKIDARVRRSKDKICTEFLLMLKEKPIRSITVRELCARCQINRTTFYKYYADPYDVLEQLEQQAFAHHRQKMQEHLPHELDCLNREVLTELKAYGSNYWVLASDHGDPQFLQKLISVNDELVYPLIEQKFPAMPEWQKKMLYQYFTQGNGGAVACWVKNGMKEPIEDVVQFLRRLNASIAERAKSVEQAL